MPVGLKILSQSKSESPDAGANKYLPTSWAEARDYGRETGSGQVNTTALVGGVECPETCVVSNAVCKVSLTRIEMSMVVEDTPDSDRGA